MRYIKTAAFALALIILASLIPFGAHAAESVISVGKSYTVGYVTPIEHAYPNLAYEPETKLTDGATAKADFNDGAWLTLYRGTAVRVVIDLGNEAAVSAVRMGELQIRSYGVYCSRYLNVYLSSDGADYRLAGSVEDEKSITSDKKQRVEFSCRFENAYKARYVMCEFSSDVFTMVDEISVLGSEDVSDALPLPDEKLVDEYRGIASPIDGIKSICLMYISANYTREMIKPYVAYVDAEGKALDRMFDSLLFLGTPSLENGRTYMHKDDMERFFDIVVGADTGLNLTALDAVIGELKGDIYDEDYKYPVFISVPFPGVANDDFGEIDGKKIKLNSLENRQAVVDWYLAHVETKFAEAGFENLELKGFYWFQESVQYSLSADEEALMAGFNAKAHEMGYKTIWIPYYCAAGIDRLDRLGFDAAALQSGYAFDGNSETGSPTAEVCIDCAETAKRFGMGIEFEADMNKNNYYNRFEQYVHAAYKYGVMTDGIMMMYQVGNHIYQSAVGSPSIRGLYELTYKYCSGTYTEYAPVIEGGKTVTLKVGEYINDKLTVTDEDTKLSELKIAEVTKPAGLYFSASGNGFFEVEAYRTSPGTYVASFSVTDGFNTSNTVEVTIIVEPAEDESSEAPEPVSVDASAEESGQGGDEKGFNPVIAVIAAIVVLLIAAAAVVIYKTKNKTKKL